MNYTAYLSGRAELELFGKLLSPVLIIAAALFLGSLYLEEARSYRKNLMLLCTVLLGVGFTGLAVYHLAIYRSVVITEPVSGNVLARAVIPLWIETEKLYFWLLSYGVLLLFRRKKESPLDHLLRLVFSVFTLAVVLFSNPFVDPLPLLHDEITQAAEILSTGDSGLLKQFLPEVTGRFKYFYGSSYMWTHPPLLFASYGAFLLSFLASCFMLAGEDEDAEKTAYDYCKAGYLLLTLGILLGYPWAITAWGNEPWWWAPKINMSLMMWLLYTAYLHSRLYLHKKGMRRATAAISILAFSILILTYATTYFIPGTHSYG